MALTSHDQRSAGDLVKILIDLRHLTHNTCRLLPGLSFVCAYKETGVTSICQEGVGGLSVDNYLQLKNRFI